MSSVELLSADPDELERRHDELNALLEESAALARSSDDSAALALALGGLSRVAGAAIDPGSAEEFDAQVADARRQLGEEFDAAWEEGSRLTPTDALARTQTAV